jgi:two-component system sensor histidine kinase KdpD
MLAWYYTVLVSDWPALRRAAFGYVCTLGLVALFTGIVAAVRSAVDAANISMVYLLAVMASAVLFGRGAGVVASVASFLAFNFFFVKPYYTLSVTDDDELVALVLLLVTGVITGQLTALLRERARDAERRETEAVLLYDAVRLVSEPDIRAALATTAERLRRELGVDAVLIAFGKESPVNAEAAAGDAEAVAMAREAALPGAILGAGKAPTEDSAGSPGRWIRIVAPRAGASGAASPRGRLSSVPILSGGGRVGSLVLLRREGASPSEGAGDRLLSAVAHQLGLAVDRLRLQREAAEAEALRRTDELRTALVNAVSHDLRTPLSSIIASADSLLQEDVTWSEQDRTAFASAILEEGKRLNRLVGNLLDMSRIESGALHPEKGWYDLGSLFEEVAGRLRPFSAGHKILLDVPDNLPPLHFDYVMIDEVITNLLENAIRHTPVGTEIRLSVRKGDGWVQVAVDDTGSGVPREALAHIFKPFYRARHGETSAVGSGLGLAVAKGFVEAHGGRIWAEAGPEGGARFAFTIPAAHQPAAAA